ncbi:unnamed protein product [Brassica oleracea var. botrytis]
MNTTFEKVGAVGGNKGGPFDDGVFDGVKKITVGKDWDCVSYIKIEYEKEKDGKFETREHGTIRGELQEFTVDYPNEYITSVGGSYEHVLSYGTVLIKSLRFKTSYGRTSPILGRTTLFRNPAGREFMLEGKNGGKLLGFHGRSGQALDAIGAHFFAVKSPLKHFNLQGGNGGSAWDDGAFDGVRKILVGRGGKFVSYVRFEYAKGRGMVPHAHGKRQEVPQEFVVDYPNEHITVVEGTIDGYLTSLRFKTSKGRTSPAFGNVVGRKFVLGEKDFKLVGFCGRSGDAIDALGAHFAPLPPPPPAPAPTPDPSTTKMGPLGGDKGKTFDDGVLNGVKKVTIGADEYSITYIKIEYENNGKVETREHGTNRGELKEFSVAYPNEYITAVGGSYKHIFNYDTTLVKSLYFTTSKGSTSPLFGELKGTEFEFKDENGGNLVGFHGRGGYAIDAIGVHFGPAPKSSTPTPPNKFSKVYITSGNEGIEEIKFYNVENGETKEVFLHGVKGKNLISTLVISNPPDECLVSVESWYNSYDVSQGIKFKTDKSGSDFFGYKFSEDVGKPFSLQVKDKKIIGVQKFHDSNLISPGTYFVLSRSSSPNKVEVIGGKGGETFDDGAFDHVRKIFVAKGDSGIAYVKFEYEKDGRRVTQEHGQKTSQETEVFEVGQDDDITSVKAYYEKLDASKTETITYLAFKTLKGVNSQPFGKTPVIVNEQTKLSLLEGGKITGFHGSSTDVLHSIGAYISTSPPTMLHGKWIQVEQNGKTPGPRCSHAIAMVGNKMYSFGGELKPNFHIDRDLYFFDFETRRWSLADPDGDVPELPCLGVCMVAIGTTLYVFGGRDGFRNYNGFYSYDTVKSEWKLITHVNNGPAPRSFHSMAADGNNIYIFGGVTTKERVNTLHAYNIVDKKWTELPNPGESCKGRGGAGLAVVQGKIWVVYGFIGEEVEDVHCFDPVESKWTKVETRGEKPWARSVFALAVVGKYIIISGGEIEMDVKAHLGPGSLTGGAFVLDTESLVWEKLEEGHSPRGWIASTSTSIDGKKGLLMYGGKAPTNGRYEDIYFYGVDSA